MNHCVSTVVFISIAITAAVGRQECTMVNKFMMEQVTCGYNSTSCSLALDIGRCLSCQPLTCEVIIGTCLFDYEANSSLAMHFRTGQVSIESPLPTSCQELEERMCGAMNRKGFLCSECKPGYGPAPYSSTVKCFECKDDGSVKLWLLYLALELVPSTFFFFVVVFFNIRTTAPPYTAFVFFSQFFALLYKIQPYMRTSLNLQVNKVFLQGILTLVSFWNLDFFRHVVPPFCISSRLTDLYVLFLDFISALYPLFLVVITLSLIELHARNFRPLVILWKPVHKYFACVRRKLDPKSSVIAASATFMSLSFSKILVTVFLSVTRSSVVDNYVVVSYRGMYDPSIHCNTTAECSKQLASTPYFFPLLILFIIVHLPTLLLLLYPIKAFRRLLCCCCSSKLHAIYIFVDTFQGHYKNGTTGSRDYRAASSISFILRTVLGVIAINHRTHYGIPISFAYLSLIFYFVLTSLFYSVVQPCRRRYMNIAECVVYSLAALMLLNVGIAHKLSPHPLFYARVYLFLVLLVLPSVMLLILSCSKIFSCGCGFCEIKRAIQMLSNSQEEEVPDRIEHPLDYAPLP